MTERPIDPIKLVLNDGKEYRFLLSMGGIRRVKEKCGAKTIAEVLQRDICDVSVPVLYEALLDRGEMTEDQFADLLPTHVEKIQSALIALFGVSMPQNTNDRPTQASPNQTAIEDWDSLKLWALWTQALGRPSSEFWELTPREVFACFDVWQQGERMKNYRAGLAASAIYNVYRPKHSEPVEPLEFFERKQTSPAEVLGVLTMLANNAQKKRRMKQNAKSR